MQVINESGRMTYRELAHIINYTMTEEQMDMDVTAVDPIDDEVGHRVEMGQYGAIGLNLVQPTQDELDGLGLDDEHPVFIALEIGE